MKEVGRMSEERLRHFNCGKCGCWWSIGDPSKKQKVWYCPWCGHKQEFKKLPISWLKKSINSK